MFGFKNFEIKCSECGNNDISLSFQNDIIPYKDGDYETNLKAVKVRAICSCCCYKEEFTDLLYKNKNLEDNKC